jgi:hypothetical protein
VNAFYIVSHCTSTSHANPHGHTHTVCARLTQTARGSIHVIHEINSAFTNAPDRRTGLQTIKSMTGPASPKTLMAVAAPSRLTRGHNGYEFASELTLRLIRAGHALVFLLPASADEHAVHEQHDDDPLSLSDNDDAPDTPMSFDAAYTKTLFTNAHALSAGQAVYTSVFLMSCKVARSLSLFRWIILSVSKPMLASCPCTCAQHPNKYVHVRRASTEKNTIHARAHTHTRSRVHAHIHTTRMCAHASNRQSRVCA